MNKQVDHLLQKQMSRKEFLTTFGFGLASLFGLGTILRLMGHNQHVSMGYGSGGYGGTKRH
jgi:hypothetical protein